ncbi:hypothetical protein ACHAXR_005730 [Thalassiosira sp. AJA248-18]
MPLPGWFTHAASFCAGATAVAAGVLLNTKATADSESDHASSQISITEDDRRKNDEPMQMLPTLPMRLFRPNNNLVIAFDTRTKNPLFVMERLVGQSSNRSDQETAVAASRKNKRFHEESALLPYHRSRNSQYRNSGYDRGHLAPAADFSSNDKEMNDTFVLTNISPQLPRFNRGIWLRMEEFVRKVAQKEEGGGGPTTNCCETWAITGPLWLPNSVAKTDSGESFRYSYEGIGRPPSLVSVPTHFYKVVVVLEKNTKSYRQSSTAVGDASSSSSNKSEAVVLKKFAAFVLPNSESVEENNDIRLVNYIVRLTDLEAVTGLEFFPALFGVYVNNSGINNGTSDLPLQKDIADALTDDVRFHSCSVEGRDTSSAVISLSSSGEWSKGRKRRVKKILRENTPIPFEHLCRKNDACFKLLRV